MSSNHDPAKTTNDLLHTNEELFKRTQIMAEKIRVLRNALKQLANSSGCFCEFGLSNFNFRDHTDSCKAASVALRTAL